MSSVFDYLESDNIYYKSTEEERRNHYYTYQEIKNIVDEINAKQSIAFQNNYCDLIKKIDSIAQQIQEIYTSKIEPTLKDGQFRSFTTDLPLILKMNIFEQEKYGLVEIINNYNEVKTVIERLKNRNSYIIQYPTHEELMMFNTTRFLKNQQRTLNQIIINQSEIFKQLQILGEAINLNNRNIKELDGDIIASIGDVQSNIQDSIEQSNYHLQNLIETSTIRLEDMY